MQLSQPEYPSVFLCSNFIFRRNHFWHSLHQATVAPNSDMGGKRGVLALVVEKAGHSPGPPNSWTRSQAAEPGSGCVYFLFLSLAAARLVWLNSSGLLGTNEGVDQRPVVKKQPLSSGQKQES